MNLFVANLILRRELDFAVSRPFRGSLWGKYHNRVFLPGDCTIEGYFFSVPNPEYSSIAVDQISSFLEGRNF